VIIELHGLTIDAGEESGGSAGADIRWEQRRLATVGTERQTTSHEENGWTTLVFATRKAAYCRFIVSPDGRHVRSEALPDVRDSTLFGFFAEAVMRVIFGRMNIVSFHGTALARDGRAIMLIGDRGAGKSTLGGALIRNGWDLVADDLVRPVRDGQGWCIHPGYRQSKLLPDTAAALGHDPAALGKRWNIGEAAVRGNKLLVAHETALRAPVTLGAIHALAPRIDAAEPAIEPLAPGDRLGVLLHHLTRGLGAPPIPPAAAFAFAAALLQDVPVMSLAMPDSLEKLVSAAAGLDQRLAAPDLPSPPARR